MDEFVEELARGNVIQVKVVLATVVMGLAGYQEGGHGDSCDDD